MTKLHSILEKDHLTPVDDVSLKALSQKCRRLEALQTEIDQQEQNIKALKVRNFKKKDAVRQYGTDKAPIHLGLVAQELEAVSPK